MASGKSPDGMDPDEAKQTPRPQTDEPDLRALAEELAEEAPLDMQRVAQLRTRIASGTYSSDPTEISRKLLELESALFPEQDTDEDDAPVNDSDSGPESAKSPGER